MLNLSNLSALQLFQLIRYGSFIVIGICFAKLQLNQTAIAQFETFILISGMLSFFWVSGIINATLSLYPKKSESEKQVLLFNTFLTLVLGSVFAAIALFFFSGNLLAFLDKQTEGTLIFLAAIYLLLNNPGFVTEYILFLNGQRRALLVYAVCSSVAVIAVAVVPVLLHFEIHFSLYGMMVVACLRILFALILLNRYAKFALDFSILKENLKLSAPLILSLLVSGSAEYIDGLIVKAKFDEVFFAVYRYGAKELPVLLIIANTFSTAMVPAISFDIHKGLAELKLKSTRLMHFFFPLSIGLLIISPVIYKTVFSASFVYSAVIFNIYLLLIIPRLVFPQTVLTGMQRTKFLLFSSLIEMAINVSLSIYLAGIMGLPGIAVGTLVAYSVDKVFLLCVVKFVYGISPGSYLQLVPFALYSILTTAAFALSNYLLSIQFWGF